jgi:hypothetical protein
LMFGLTDASYDQWILRVDLHQIAMYGRSAAPPLQPFMPPEADEPSQPDNVRVTLKRKNIEKGRA